MRAWRRFLTISAMSLVLLAGGTRVASAQGRVDVEKARAAYLARNYAEAEERLRALVDGKTALKDLALLSQARMYLAAVLLAQGKREPGAEAFEKLILEDPAFEPDPLSFPGDVINTFFDVRAQLQEKIRQAAQNAARVEAEKRAHAEEERRRQEAWLARVKQMATEEKITTKNRRLVACLPFGAGQFQNQEPVLGWTFLATEAALVLGTMITVPMFVYADGRAQGQGSDLQGKAQVYKDRADTIQAVNVSLAAAFVAVAATGIIQANLAYVPEVVEIKKRELPAQGKVSWSPTLAPLTRGEGSAIPNGVMVGVAGTVF
ncbi:MAG: Tetratricopeptide repeat domain protein [Labilithrix sp.]|nr:Tetratricopeptide repeat domain protein [Labilithrix sp.]